MINILTYQFQIILILLDLLAITLITNMVRKKKLDLKYALPWFFVCISGLILALFPRLLIKIADIMAIYSDTNALFLMAFLFVAIILFSLTVALSRASKKIRVLAQELALLQKEKEHNINN